MMKRTNYRILDISQLSGPRNWVMAGGSNGYRVAPVRRQFTPGLISSLPGTAGLRPFISFSTSYPEPGLTVSQRTFWLRASDPRMSCLAR